MIAICGPGTAAPFTTVAVAQASGETDVNTSDFELLTTGATGLPAGVLDTRVPGAGTLPPGPFQLQGPNLTDDDYTYSDVRTAPAGFVYAMRSSYARPPHPVRIDPDPKTYTE